MLVRLGEYWIIILKWIWEKIYMYNNSKSIVPLLFLKIIEFSPYPTQLQQILTQVGTNYNTDKW